MQERIMDLLVVVENEDVTVELIQVNEDLNNAILGYERWAVARRLRPSSSASLTSRYSGFLECLQVSTQKDQEQVLGTAAFLPR